MAEDSFKNMLFGFVFFLFFSILLITVVNEEGALYSKDVSEVTGGSLNINSFNSTIIDISNNVKGYRETFEKQNIFVALGDVLFNGIWDVAKSMVAVVTIPFSLLAGIMNNILKVPVWITDIILALIGLALIFAIWRLIKIGD